MFTLTTAQAAVRVNMTAKTSKRNVTVSAKPGFSDSLAGKSNWNAYEGSAEKPLTKEELKAKNAKEDAEAAARRAASAAKMAAERAAAEKK